MNDNVEISEQEGVLEIRLSRPEKKNALTADMYLAMTCGLKHAAARSEIGAVLFSGHGDAYCAGNDLKDFASGPDSSRAAFDFIGALAAFEKPMVAAVQGLAVGIGATMLFHVDLVYVEPNARFIMPFVNLGLVPEAGSSLLASSLFGHAKAAEMLLLGEPFDAAAGERAGFVTAIVAQDRLLEHARAKAAAIMAMPPLALGLTRSLLRGDRTAILARIETEAELFAQALTSPESKEAFAAFFEKRQPDFGRL